MKKTQQGGIKILILAIIIIALIVMYYFHLSNKREEIKENSTAITETDEVLLRNLETNYPPSPKEVVKLYAQISKCFYDRDWDEAELVRLANMSRALLDDELKSTQTDEEYLKSLKKDIDDYASKDMKISSYSTSSSVDVEYKNTSKGEMASLYCVFNVRQASTILTSNQEYVLRKDSNGHWKILGWRLAKDND